MEHEDVLGDEQRSREVTAPVRVTGVQESGEFRGREPMTPIGSALQFQKHFARAPLWVALQVFPAFGGSGAGLLFLLPNGGVPGRIG